MVKSTNTNTAHTPLELITAHLQDWRLLKEQLEAQADPAPQIILDIDYCAAKLVELDAEISLLQS